MRGLPAWLSYPLRVWGWGWAGAGNSSAELELSVVVAAQKENVVLSPMKAEQKTLKINPRRLKMKKRVSS